MSAALYYALAAFISAITGGLGYLLRFYTDRGKLKIENKKAKNENETTQVTLLLQQVTHLQERIGQLEARIDHDRRAYDERLEELRSENNALRDELHQQKMACAACKLFDEA